MLGHASAVGRAGERHRKLSAARGLELAEARALGDSEADAVTIGARGLDHDRPVGGAGRSRRT